jgi:hypothetical protein
MRKLLNWNHSTVVSFSTGSLYLNETSACNLFLLLFVVECKVETPERSDFYDKTYGTLHLPTFNYANIYVVNMPTNYLPYVI